MPVPATNIRQQAFIDRYGPYLDAAEDAFRAFLKLPDVHEAIDLGDAFNLRYLGSYPCDRATVLDAFARYADLRAQIGQLGEGANLDLSTNALWAQFRKDHRVVRHAGRYHVFAL